MQTPLNIALVEDNDDLRDLLTRDIARAGHRVYSAECSDDLDDLAVHTVFNLLILDLNLPGEDGLSIAARYKRVNPDLYVIMLTARGSEVDKIKGYESGADVYLTKPVSSAELMAAVGSVLRRMKVKADALEFNLNVRTMSLTGVKTIELNRQEVIILKALSESPQGNLPYFRLLELCGEKEVNEHTKAALEVRVVRLRKKLAYAGAKDKSIRALRGEGYQLLLLINIT